MKFWELVWGLKSKILLNAWCTGRGGYQSGFGSVGPLPWARFKSDSVAHSEHVLPRAKCFVELGGVFARWAAVEFLGVASRETKVFVLMTVVRCNEVTIHQ